jgi:hypothetical protein
MKITHIQLATIISQLLLDPQRFGSLDEADLFFSFVTDLADVVCDHVGGEVIDVSALGRLYMIDVESNDSSPEDGFFWEPEALQKELSAICQENDLAMEV